MKKNATWMKNQTQMANEFLNPHDNDVIVYDFIAERIPKLQEQEKLDKIEAHLALKANNVDDLTKKSYDLRADLAEASGLPERISDAEQAVRDNSNHVKDLEDDIKVLLKSKNNKSREIELKEYELKRRKEEVSQNISVLNKLRSKQRNAGNLSKQIKETDSELKSAQYAKFQLTELKKLKEKIEQTSKFFEHYTNTGTNTKKTPPTDVEAFLHENPQLRKPRLEDTIQFVQDSLDFSAFRTVVSREPQNVSSSSSSVLSSQ